MEVRKLQLIGGSSYMISLPKDWIRENTLNQGDEIALSKHEQYLRIQPKKYAEDQPKKVHINKIYRHDEKFINRFILHLYLHGYDEITIEDKAITPNTAMRISEIAKKFAGMEVIHAGDDQIVLKCLSIPEMDTISLITRMLQLTSGMMDSIEDGIRLKDSEELLNVQKFKEETLRLFHLITRYENKLSSVSQISPKIILANSMVEMAKSLSELAEEVGSFQGESLADTLIFLRELKNILNSSIEAYIEANIEKSEQLVHEIKKIELKSRNVPYSLRLGYKYLKLISETAFDNAIKVSIIGSQFKRTY